ncbi:MAG: fucose isomerase [Verrucomicrobia bacterium]|nr:MAG: fucose isomerase [Verrucomicrobiota bacterium]
MKTVYLIANGDVRLSANRVCQAAQAAMETLIAKSIEREGWRLQRAHDFDAAKQHGFIDSQKYGMHVIKSIPADAPLIVAEAVWMYSHHILAGLISHRGPILTVANWSGTWPGLVGLLNLNASLTKAGVKYSSLWSEDFSDAFFTKGLHQWLHTGVVTHDESHVRPYENGEVSAAQEKIGTEFARDLKDQKAIMGIFDEGCMGMYNAIIPDELLHQTGIFKERLSQSTLYAKMLTVADHEARATYDWYLKKGMKFKLGTNEATDLTENQILRQCKMYIAAVRLADDFGCGTIGIQYQLGLNDLTPASDLVEGTLNNVERPPVYSEDGRELFPGEAIPHFNEVDECAGLDGLITYQLWRKLGYPPENTLHDLRWGRHYCDGKIDAYVWVLLISGSVPPAHFADHWAGATGERQPPMYFHLGGSTLKGISKPGWLVWSRVYIQSGKLAYDTGLLEAVELPQKETEDRWNLTTSQWPILHGVLSGISRDQMMARHKSNHIQVVYAPSKEKAVHGLKIKAAAMKELGLEVFFCGDLTI